MEWEGTALGPRPWICCDVRCRGERRGREAVWVTVADEIQLGCAQSSDPGGRSHKIRAFTS